MRFIVKDIETYQHYVINAEAGNIEWMGTEENCREYIKYMIFHDFWFSVKDIHGCDRVPSVTLDYLEMVNNNHRLYPACGWWEKPIAPTIGDPTDPDRFIDCTSYYYP